MSIIIAGTVSSTNNITSQMSAMEDFMLTVDMAKLYHFATLSASSSLTDNSFETPSCPMVTP